MKINISAGLKRQITELHKNLSLHGIATLQISLNDKGGISIEPIDIFKTSPPPFKEIVEYLNLKTGRKYKHTAAATKRLIKKLWNDYSIEDFKKVIDIKCSKWLNDPEYSTYLRPETLFGNKFDTYLNEPHKEEKDIGKEVIGLLSGLEDKEERPNARKSYDF